MPVVKPLTLAEAQDQIYALKFWAADEEGLPWKPIKGPGLPPGYFFRVPLHSDEAGLADLFLEVFYKAPILPGLSPALTVDLRQSRLSLLRLQAGLGGDYFNHLGQGEDFYQASIAHPLLLRTWGEVSQGYAEPLPASAPEDLWEDFLLLANILEAPGLTWPLQEQERLL